MPRGSSAPLGAYLKGFRDYILSGFPQYRRMTGDRFPHLLQPSCAQCAGIGLRMPDLLWDMEDDCGEDALRAFLVAHGGRQYCSTSRRAEDEESPLGRARHWLYARVGTGRIMIPLGPMSYQARVQWTIYDRIVKGHSLSQIAAELGCDTRTVGVAKAKFRKSGALLSHDTRPSTPENRSTP